MYLSRETYPGNFHFFTLPLEFLDQKKPLDSPQNCVRSLGNSNAKNKDPCKFDIIFSCSPLEIPLCFYLTPGNFTCYLFETPGNSISSTLIVWIFSGIAQCMFQLFLTEH